MLQRAVMARWLLSIVGLASLPSSQAKSKLPPWSGPENILDGALPSNRSQHGFVSCDDGRIYVFGGKGQQGEMPDIAALRRFGSCKGDLTYTQAIRGVVAYKHDGCGFWCK